MFMKKETTTKMGRPKVPDSEFLENFSLRVPAWATAWAKDNRIAIREFIIKQAKKGNKQCPLNKYNGL